MSYYTHVTFEFSDVPPSAGEVSKVARAWLTDQNLYGVEDVLEVFLRGWEVGYTEFKGLVSEDIDGLMAHISAQYPEIRFHLRGMGEEFADVWLRQYQNGKIIFKLGPFEINE